MKDDIKRVIDELAAARAKANEKAAEALAPRIGEALPTKPKSDGDKAP
jgi:hypothetical protein